MSESLADGGGDKSAKVYESRGAGGKSRDLRALGELTGRVLCLNIGGSFGYVRKKQFCKIIVIHRFISFRCRRGCSIIHYVVEGSSELGLCTVPCVYREIWVILSQQLK